MSKVMYGIPLQNFPTVSDCLQKSEWRKRQPDLIKIDWDKIDWSEEAEVCLFRIASSYEQPEHMKKWFELQGFEKVSLKHYKDIDDTLTGKSGVSGGYDFKQKGFLLYPNVTVKLWLELIVYHFGCGVRYDHRGKVSDTYCSLLIL